MTGKTQGLELLSLSVRNRFQSRYVIVFSVVVKFSPAKAAAIMLSF
jgi:hypothetical protein